MIITYFRHISIRFSSAFYSKTPVLGVPMDSFLFIYVANLLMEAVEDGKALSIAVHNHGNLLIKIFSFEQNCGHLVGKGETYIMNRKVNSRNCASAISNGRSVCRTKLFLKILARSSGKCQIIHWRQVHRQECQPLAITWNNSSPQPGLIEENLDDLTYNSVSSSSSASVSCSSIDASQVSAAERKSKEKRVSRKLCRGISRKDDRLKYDFLDEVSGNMTECSSSFNSCPRKEAFVRHKVSSFVTTLFPFVVFS